MKTLFRTTAIAGCLLMACGTFAQTKLTPAHNTVAAKPMKTVRGGEATSPLNVAQMTKELGLKPDQVTKLKEIAKKYMENSKTMAKLDPKERSLKEKALMTRRDRDVQSVLTPEQAKQWTMIQQKEQKMQMQRTMKAKHPSTLAR